MSTITQSRNSPGTVTWTVPAGATSVTFTIAAGSGGGSKSFSGSLWDVVEVDLVEAGNFTIAPRSGSYNLTFYIGGQGGDGVGPRILVAVVVLLSLVVVVDIDLVEAVERYYCI